jgi:hypothetical protein
MLMGIGPVSPCAGAGHRLTGQLPGASDLDVRRRDCALEEVVNCPEAIVIAGERDKGCMIKVTSPPVRGFGLVIDTAIGAGTMITIRIPKSTGAYPS